MSVGNFVSASRSSLAGATDTLVWAPVSAGSTLFGVIRTGNTSTVTMTDSVNGSAWTLIGPVDNGAGRMYFAYFQNTAAGTPTLNFTHNSSGLSPRYAFGEITNALAASFDVQASTTGTSTAITGGITATTAQAAEAWIGGLSAGGNETFSQSGSWTILGVEPAAGTSRLVLVYQEVSATGTPQAAVTGSSSQAFIGYTVTFRQAGGVTFDPSVVPWQAADLPTPGLAVVGF